jgi:hypothetical protein
VHEVIESVALMLKLFTRCLHGREFGRELGFASTHAVEFALNALAFGGRCRLHSPRWGPGLGSRHIRSYSGLGHCE